MTKKHFIELADTIRLSHVPFTDEQINVLARFCKSQNGRFDRDIFIGYIKGECGPSGGKIKQPKQ